MQKYTSSLDDGESGMIYFIQGNSLHIPLAEEIGISLVASNWRLIGTAGGGSWSSKNRKRIDTHPLQKKMLWEIEND
jgi:hypothetical protein